MNTEFYPMYTCDLLPRDPELIKRSMDVIGREDSSFNTEEVAKIIKEALERIIGNKEYDQSKISRWTADSVDQILTELTNLDRPFKYIVQTIILEKTGGGFHTASSCYWNNTTDGSCTLRWENKYLYTIVSVYGLLI